jgi:hypothetical protein
MDRGFYSENNINALFKDHVKFPIASKMSLSFVRQNLDPIYEQFRFYDHFSERYELYYHTVQTEDGITHNIAHAKGIEFQHSGASTCTITTALIKQQTTKGHLITGF